MSWVRESTLTWIQRIAINVIKCGPLPNHVAFIMDGNRRYATKNNMASKTDGHAKGFDKLSEALEWCLEVGIKEVTVYAFSIENFKRSSDEVDTLMSLAREKFARLMQEKDKLNERGICIRIIGNLAMLPLDLQRIMAEAVLLTQHNSNAILNVAFAYTSRDEITESIREIVRGVENKELRTEDVSDALIRRCMYTSKSPDPDLMVRTSGEARLSDFMLWQISTTIIYFTKTLWPEFTIWHLLAGIFYYQKHHRTMTNARRHLDAYTDKTIEANANEARIEAFLEKFDKRRTDHLQQLVCSEITTQST